MPLSAIAIWSHNQLTNTDRYVETVSPLADNKDIQQTVAAVVVNALFERANARQRIENALPKRAKFLGEPIATAMRSYATDVTEKLLASSQFEKLWDAANRRAHNQLVALLTDDPSKAHGAVTLEKGQVQLDLGVVVKQVQAKLVGAGLTFLNSVNVPPVSTTIDIINTEGLAEARSYLSILDTLAWVLPFLAIVCLVAAAVVVPTRRRATIRAGIVLTASCRVHARAPGDRPIALPRRRHQPPRVEGRRLGGVRHPRAQPAVRPHRARCGRPRDRTGGVLRGAVGAGGEGAGPGRRRGLGRPAGRRGTSATRATRSSEWVAAHRRGLELAVAGIAVLALILWDRPGLGAVLFVLVVALILVGFIEFFARGATPEPVDEPTAA